MPPETIDLGEPFERSIAFEGLCESINNEMARHNALAYEAGKDTELGKRHMASMAALAEVRQYLSPNQPELLRVVELMLRSGESDQREPSAA